MKIPSEDSESISLLKVHEWLSIAILIGVIAGLACLTSLNAKVESGRSGIGSIRQKFSGFDVLVKGAVDHPGVYHINSEIGMGDLLSLVGLSSNADLRRFNMDSVIKKGRVVNVPARAMIEIHLKGAVEEEKILTLPKGSKLEDLIPLFEFAPEANVKALQKKRRLKDGETIIVPRL